MLAVVNGNVNALYLTKLGIVALVIVGGLVLVGMGRLDARDFFGDLDNVVTGLLIALGITGAGLAVAHGQRDAARLGSMRPPPPREDTLP